MRVHPVPCLRDNYAYLVHAEHTDDCIVVDPSEPAPVLTALYERGLRLRAILNTHHHHDHVGGNDELLRRHPRIDVFGHASDKGRIPGQTRFLEHGEHFEVVDLGFDILHIPGHTTGAIAYCGHGSAFTGDTLFAAGCGRLFEGTPQMMFESLNQKLGSLPDDTHFYFGHEYTENNLRFAASVEPDNADIAKRRAHVAEQRSGNVPTTPTTLAEERRTNPFLRCHIDAVARGVGLEPGSNPVEVLARVRKLKDDF
jgi:hydroxyacylglutathione hydrolase